MRNDLLIMLRVLLLGLFVWATLVWSFAFVCVFWLLVGIAMFVAWKEAKDAKEIKVIEEVLGTPFDEDLYKGDVFPEPHMEVKKD